MSTNFNPSDEALAYTARRYSRPPWASGTISRSDAAFLFDMVTRERPRAIAEIGVSSGTSTAFLSTLLSDRLEDSRLYSFDRLDCLDSDPTRPVGAYLYELFGRLPANLVLGAGVASSDIRSWPARPQQFDFVFLDASHLHPMPCLDLLAMIDVIRPGAWVVLHDVWLALTNREFQQYGPLYLYQSWPGEKCAPFGNNANIGAVRLFADPKESAAALIDCCRIPWQNQMPSASWQSPLQALSQIDADHCRFLRAIVENPPFARRPHLRNCEIVIRGANPWSHLAPDLVSERMLLHANPRGEPAMSVEIRGLRRSQCSGLILPSITRSDDTESAMSVTLTLKSGGFHEAGHTLVLADDTNRFVWLTAPDGIDEVFDVRIAVSLAEESENLKGAWVKFEAVHFV